MLTGWLSWLARRTRPARPGTRPAKGSHAVICNDAGEYLIWPSDHSLPANWHEVGKYGSMDELRAYLQETLAETKPTPLMIDPERRW
jgi:MbtH protein